MTDDQPRSLIEVVVRRCPSAIDDLLELLPPVGTRAATEDLERWQSMRNWATAYHLVWSRCGGDSELLTRTYDLLIDLMMRRLSCLS